jgi:hypothetical protein
MEHMHDEATEVHQNPRQRVQTFDSQRFDSRLCCQFPLDVLNDRPHLARTRSARDDEPIGDAYHLSYKEGLSIVGLAVSSGVDREADLIPNLFLGATSFFGWI